MMDKYTDLSTPAVAFFLFFCGGPAGPAAPPCRQKSSACGAANVLSDSGAANHQPPHAVHHPHCTGPLGERGSGEVTGQRAALPEPPLRRCTVLVPCTTHHHNSGRRTLREHRRRGVGVLVWGTSNHPPGRSA